MARPLFWWRIPNSPLPSPALGAKTGIPLDMDDHVRIGSTTQQRWNICSHAAACVAMLGLFDISSPERQSCVRKAMVTLAASDGKPRRATVLRRNYWT
jgi:hypothetical protein